MMMKKKLLITLCVLSTLVSCRLHDGPPKTDHLGPVPSPHDGVFVCGSDTLFFNGDGKTVRWSFSKPYESLAAQGEGSYVFLLYNGSYRYDAAEEFSIYDGQKSHKFMTLVGSNNEDQVAFYTVEGENNKDVQNRFFKKVK